MINIEPYLQEQKIQIDKLTNVIKNQYNGKIWLFYGPKDVGKLSIAQWFANALHTKDISYNINKKNNITDIHIFNAPIEEEIIEKINLLLYQTALIGNNKTIIINNISEADNNIAALLFNLIKEENYYANIIILTSNSKIIPNKIKSIAKQIYFSTKTKEQIALKYQSQLPNHINIFLQLSNTDENILSYLIKNKKNVIYTYNEIQNILLIKDFIKLYSLCNDKNNHYILELIIQNIINNYNVKQSNIFNQTVSFNQDNYTIINQALKNIDDMHKLNLNAKNILFVNLSNLLPLLTHGK